MAFQLAHVITKKIDNSGAYLFWFKIFKRPTGSFFIEFNFFKPDTKEAWYEKIKITKLDRATVELNKGKKEPSFETFRLTVPYGSEISGISVRAKLATFSKWTPWAELPISGHFEDITIAEARTEEEVKEFTGKISKQFIEDQL